MCMGKTTITVSDTTLERFRSLKADVDDAQDGPDHSNESFLQALMDTWEAAEDGYYDDSDGVIHEQLDRIESSAQTVEERTNRIEQTLEEMEGRLR